MQRFRCRENRRSSVFVAVLVCPAWIAVGRAIGAKELENRKTCSVKEASVSQKPARSKGTNRQTDEQALEHPDGAGKWEAWGIEPRALAAQKRLEQRWTIDRLLGAKSTGRKQVLLELAGEKEIDKARTIVEILGVDSVPYEPKRASMRLSDDALRSVEGFVISSALETRPRELNPDRVAYTHVATEERVRVHIIYDDSPAGALCRFIRSSSFMFSAPLGLVLPTCRIMKGPGDLCWLGWSRSNEQRTLYFPSEADILFIRNGVAVHLVARDAAEHESVMELARKIDALLLKQAKRAQE